MLKNKYGSAKAKQDIQHEINVKQVGQTHSRRAVGAITARNYLKAFQLYILNQNFHKFNLQFDDKNT